MSHISCLQSTSQQTACVLPSFLQVFNNPQNSSPSIRQSDFVVLNLELLLDSLHHVYDHWNVQKNERLARRLHFNFLLTQNVTFTKGLAVEHEKKIFRRARGVESARVWIFKRFLLFILPRNVEKNSRKVKNHLRWMQENGKKRKRLVIATTPASRSSGVYNDARHLSSIWWIFHMHLNVVFWAGSGVKIIEWEK